MVPLELESFDIPAVGEVKARPGTSTHELAGAVKYWHDKSKTASRDGFIRGFAYGGALVVGIEIAYNLVRSFL